MKKILLLAIMAMAAQVAVAQDAAEGQQTAKEKILYIIDGKVVPKDAFEKMPSDNIKNINVIKGVESVLIMNTKMNTKGVVTGVYVLPDAPGDKASDAQAADDKATVNDSTATRTIYSTNSLHIRVRDKDGNDLKVKSDPLIIVKDNEGNVKVAKTMDDIKVEDIKAISVRKDNNTQEFKKYGDISYGVIIVELK
ncbi:MAG: hypothetical protein IJ383_04510 [Bacteroidales bacterium]|nr:hypothetical protein [Bacteroidales bacterium]